MRISQRLLVLFIVIAFAFGAFFYLFFHIKQQEMKLYGESDTIQRRYAIDTIFQLKRNNQQLALDDYALSDETVGFVKNRNLH
mgnify:CR=1 FL=1